MGKRLTRLSGLKMYSSLPKLVGNDVSVVLLNGATFYGTIMQSTPSTCLFKDLRNYKHTFSIDQIAEIITDNVSSY